MAAAYFKLHKPRKRPKAQAQTPEPTASAPQAEAPGAPSSPRKSAWGKGNDLSELLTMFEGGVISG